MAKQSGGMPKIDEDFMKELISQGVPSKQDNNKTNDVPWKIHSPLPPSVHFKVIPQIHSKVTP